MNHLGEYIPREECLAILQYVSSQEKHRIAEVCDIHVNTINNLLARRGKLTEGSALAFDKLVSCAKENARQSIQVAGEAIEVLSDINPHSIGKAPAENGSNSNRG